MVSILLISISSCLVFLHLETVPSPLTTTGIRVTFMFHSFVSSLARSKCLFIFSLSFIFICSHSEWQNRKKTSSFFFSCLLKLGLVFLAEIWRTAFISKFYKILYVSFCRTDSGLGIYHLEVWSISCTIPSGSPFPPTNAKSCTSFVQVCCIRLLCDKLFYFCLHRDNTCYSVAYYQFIALI